MLSTSWSWDLLYFKGWRLAVGGWWRLAVDGGWRRLVVGGQAPPHSLGREWVDSPGITFVRSKREAMQATKKRDAPCSRSVFKSEGGMGGGQKIIFLLRFLFADVILAKGMPLRNNFLRCFLFMH